MIYFSLSFLSYLRFKDDVDLYKMGHSYYPKPMLFLELRFKNISSFRVICVVLI